MRDIGKNIRSARIRKKMTQDELAEKLFVIRQTVSNYENGKSRPDVEILMSIAEIVSVELNELLYGSEEPPEKKKKIRQLLALSVIALAVWIAALAVLPALEKLAGTYFITQPLIFIRGIVFPALCFLTGWLAAFSFEIFLGAKPAKLPAVKIIFRVLLVVMLIAALLGVVAFVSLLFEFNIPLIGNLSARILMFFYKFPYATLPFGITLWLSDIGKDK